MAGVDPVHVTHLGLASAEDGIGDPGFEERHDRERQPRTGLCGNHVRDHQCMSPMWRPPQSRLGLEIPGSSRGGTWHGAATAGELLGQAIM